MRKLAIAAFCFAGGIFVSRYFLPFEWLLVFGSGAGRMHRLSEELSAKDAAESSRLVVSAKSVSLEHFEAQCSLEVVECMEGRRLQW